jgi:ATP-binding cassette, subfamily B, bacterial
MRLTFPFHKQKDAMDCGPACLMMITAYYKKHFSLPYLREMCAISRDGVSALGISQAAESLGLQAMVVKVFYTRENDEKPGLINAPLPCIAHWNQNHFVVIYKVTKSKVWIADPGAGKFTLKKADFLRSWGKDNGQGVLILLSATPDFFQHNSPTPSVKGSFSYLFQYLRPYRRLISQMVIGMLLGSVFQLIFPFLTQSIVDVGIENRNIGFVYLILIGQLVMFLSQISISFIQSRILVHIGTRINVALIADFLMKLMRLPLSYFDSKRTGDLMQRIGDQSRIESFLTQSSLSIVFSFINFIVFSVVLLLYNPTIFFIFLVAAICYVLWIVLFLRQRKKIDYKRFQQMSDNSSTLIELIQGMPEIKLQGSERKRRWQWASIQAQLFHINLKSLNLAQIQEAGASFFTQVKDILITVVAATAVIEGKMTLGMMLATQYIVGQLNAPLQQFISFIRAAQDAKISMERMGEIHDEPDENAVASASAELVLTDLSVNAITDKSVETGSVKTEATLHIENLSFKYTNISDEVLSDITLTIPHGKVTAIVGSSGSGKTTLVKLLLGFYKPTKGTIKVGTTNLTNISPSAWRQHCGAVMQDGFIFSDTIARNIAECDDYPDKARLLKAVQTANIQEFIESMPWAYNTMIGAKGNGISAGQRQRMLIARAVYKKPDFMFFDEATNALDSKNERVIVENLANFFKDRTVVVVAHRLSTVKNADQIVVLENGRVVELGTHTQLVLKRGVYYNLVRNQLELGE